MIKKLSEVAASLSFFIMFLAVQNTVKDMNLLAKYLINIKNLN